MAVFARISLAALVVFGFGTADATARTAPAATRTVTLAAAPVALTVADGSLWALAENGVGAVVLRLDPRTGARRAVVRVGSAGPDMGGVVSGLGRLWAAAGNRLLRIDPTSPVATARARLPGVASAVAVEYGSVWVTVITPQGDLLLRLDPASLAIAARIRVGSDGATAVAAGLGSVWVADGGSLVRVDPRADRTSASFPSAPPPRALAPERGRLWALDGNVVQALDRRDHVVEQIDLPVTGARFAIADGRLWVTDDCGCRQGTLVELDLRSKRVLARLPAGETPIAVATGQSAVWVASFGSRTLSRFNVS